MLVLGINGGPDLLHENAFGFTPGTAHDAAAVLLEDGNVVFAIEEERLSRVKHTNAFPARAIQAALAARGATIDDVDAIAYYATRELVDRWMRQLYLGDARRDELLDGVTVLQRAFRRGLHAEVDAAKLCFVHHHEAHAMSALAFSGFDRALVTTFDAQGDRSAGMIFRGVGTTLEPLVNLPVSKSLGFWYLDVIGYLGYGLFDEYKVMGLAPYGDPTVHRELFQTFYSLLPNGDFALHRDRLARLFDLAPPRRKGTPFTKLHQDLAAALQASLEEIALHVLRHYRESTGERHLCLAGGVAHNCTLNGKILRSGLFDRVFVQPAAHDAGCALGAALCVHHREHASPNAPRALRHVYWGTDIGYDLAIENTLNSWAGVVTVDRPASITDRASELLAGGQVLAWVQGRSEFGPRALGNRSILADPRPASNKDRINQMVKKREGYRPFAPSVLEEDVANWFDVPPAESPLDFMISVLPVRAAARQQLGAITHVDGTARVQTVSRATNPRYWDLIDAFRRRTGVPMLLNTSFNNDVEPIVDSVEDALTCFLTTGIDHLVVGDCLVSRRDVSWRAWLDFRIALPVHVAVAAARRFDPSGEAASTFTMTKPTDPRFSHAITEAVFDVVNRADGRHTLRELLEVVGENEARAIVADVLELWSRRLIVLTPARVDAPTEGAGAGAHSFTMERGAVAR